MAEEDVITDEDKKTKTKYRLHFEISIDGLDYLITGENVGSMSILHDYIRHNMPVYMLRLYVPMNVYLDILDLIKPFRPVIEKVDVRIMVYEQDGETNETIYEEDYHTFRSYNNMNAIMDKVEDYDDVDKDNMDETGDGSDDKKMLLTFTLYNKDEVGAVGKGYSNNILPSGTPNQMLYDIIDKCVNDNINVYPVNSSNNTSFSNAVLPPLGFDESINYIHDEYGLYKYPPTRYCRDNTLFIFPLTGDISDQSTAPYNKTIYLDIRNSLNINYDDYVYKDDDKVLHVIIGKDRFVRNKIYNIKHTCYGYIGNDGFREPKKDGTLVYDKYKIISKNGSAADVSEDIKQRMALIPLNMVSPEIDIYPVTRIKVIYDKAEGWYRVGKFIESFTANGYTKQVEIYAIDET